MYGETVVASQFCHRGFLLEHHQCTTLQAFDCSTEISQRIHQPGLVGHYDNHPIITGNGGTHTGHDGGGGEEHVALMVQHTQIVGCITCLSRLVHHHGALFG